MKASVNHYALDRSASVNHPSDSAVQNPFAVERHSADIGVFVENFFSELARRGIRHSLLRHYEDYPIPRSGRSDFDVLVDPNFGREVDTILTDQVKVCGLKLLNGYTRLNRFLRTYFVGANDGPALRIDLLVSLGQEDAEAVLNEVVPGPAGGPPVPRPGHEAVLALFGNLFYHGEAKPDYRTRYPLLIEQDQAAFVSLVEGWSGHRKAAELAELIKTRDWGGVAEWGKQIQIKLARERRRKPWAVLKRFPLQAAVALERVLYPRGLFIAIIGPDGCGKSTITSALALALQSAFAAKKQRVHWRPEFLPAPGRLFRRKRAERGSVTNPHGLPPYGRSVSVLRMLYFWIDFVIGVPLRFWPMKVRDSLILVERYYYDFHIDPLRYRIDAPQWIARALGKFVPRPDLVFYLDAPEEVLAERKKELSFEELRRQRQAFLALTSDMGTFGKAIEADRPIEAVVTDIRRAIFAHMAERCERYRKKSNGWFVPFGQTAVDFVRR
ncbi:MAG TPA: hypothetical protein VFH31_00390 [Pyrinomonadaceae bacterium]|nr:hypothetical protein [Pyrinomonadaceae bacterium]